MIKNLKSPSEKQLTMKQSVTRTSSLFFGVFVGCVNVLYFCPQATRAANYFRSTEVMSGGGSGFYVYHQYPVLSCQPHIKPDMVRVSHTHTPFQTMTHSVCYSCLICVCVWFVLTVQPRDIWWENTTDGADTATGVDGWMSGWMGGWMDGSVDGWMDQWMDGWIRFCEM